MPHPRMYEFQGVHVERRMGWYMAGKGGWGPDMIIMIIELPQ